MLKGKKLYEFDEHYRIIITLSVRADPPFLIYDPWINKERKTFEVRSKKNYEINIVIIVVILEWIFLLLQSDIIMFPFPRLFLWKYNFNWRKCSQVLPWVVSLIFNRATLFMSILNGFLNGFEIEEKIQFKICILVGRILAPKERTSVDF